VWSKCKEERKSVKGTIWKLSAESQKRLKKERRENFFSFFQQEENEGKVG